MKQINATYFNKKDKEVSYLNNANMDIRYALMLNDVKHCKVANALGICKEEFSRMLKHELAYSEKEKILRIIMEIANERGDSKND